MFKDLIGSQTILISGAGPLYLFVVVVVGLITFTSFCRGIVMNATEVPHHDMTNPRNFTAIERFYAEAATYWTFKVNFSTNTLFFLLEGDHGPSAVI